MALVIGDSLALERVTNNNNIRRIHEYWLTQRGAKAFPSRQDIDPPSFSFALGWVSLIEVTADRRFRYRLVSSRLTDILGYEATGKFVAEIGELNTREYVTGFYAQAVEAAAPLYDADVHTYRGSRRPYEALALPLASTASAIDMLMVYREVGKSAPAHMSRSSLMTA